jgi:hypothetical protein
MRRLRLPYCCFSLGQREGALSYKLVPTLESGPDRRVSFGVLRQEALKSRRAGD